MVPPVFFKRAQRTRRRRLVCALRQLLLTNLLFIGDIFGSVGRGIVARQLPEIVVTENIHLTIANGENAAAGFGITPQLADEIFGYGVDVITSGNHIWDKREIYEYLQSSRACFGRRIIRLNCRDRA